MRPNIWRGGGFCHVYAQCTRLIQHMRVANTFTMMYVLVWLRRFKLSTRGEWISTRFVLRKCLPPRIWKPAELQLKVRCPQLKTSSNFKRDMFNVAIRIVWQLCLTLIPMYIVIQHHLPLVATILVLGITSLILKKNWYDKMIRD